MNARKDRRMKDGVLIVNRLIMFCLLAVNICFAFDMKNDVTFHGTVFLEDGQVVSGKYLGSSYTAKDFKNLWMPKSALNFTLQADVLPWLSIVLEPELQVWYFSMKQRWANYQLSGVRFTPQYSIFIQNAFGNIHFGGADSLFQVQIGTFLYKYNPEAVDLGEYLFRTGCYPGNIDNQFDFTYGRLTGIHLNSTHLNGSLRQDLFFTTEQDVAPFGDWSLSYVAGYSVGKWLSLGLGGSLWRFLPQDDSTTTPRHPKNSFLKSDGDTGYYSFGGTKLMARGTIDIKSLFGWENSILGQEDLKIFAEAAILGVKDYTAYKDTVVYANPDDLNGKHLMARTNGYYDSLWQRMPIMFGMNIPAFKLLDKLALQFEWYGSRWPVGPYSKKFDEFELPLPSLSNEDNTAASDFYDPKRGYNYHTDDWKWVLYAKKTFDGHFSIVAQMGRDHLKHRINWVPMQDITDMMPKPSHWYWMVKTLFQF
jgi:hypothetical protein